MIYVTPSIHRVLYIYFLYEICTTNYAATSINHCTPSYSNIPIRNSRLISPCSVANPNNLSCPLVRCKWPSIHDAIFSSQDTSSTCLPLAKSTQTKSGTTLERRQPNPQGHTSNVSLAVRPLRCNAKYVRSYTLFPSRRVPSASA